MGLGQFNSQKGKMNIAAININLRMQKLGG